MRILIVYPAVTGLNNGNSVTARRWQQCLRQLGHTVEIAATFDDAAEPPELLIALHAIKSSDSIERCKAAFAEVPIILVLTGTDLYGSSSAAALHPMLRVADRVVVLQNASGEDIDQQFRDKIRVIYQGINPIEGAFESTSDYFEVCVVGHLRPVKDPFQVAQAVRDLPSDSKLRVTQIGAAMTDQMRETAERLHGENPRFSWIGEVSRADAMERIVNSHLLVNSSKVEGGAAVICEAVVAGTPILATRISGNIGLLGQDYEGLFDVGNTRQLRAMLLRAENSIDFYQRLKDQCERRKHFFDPDLEKRKWGQLIEEFES